MTSRHRYCPSTESRTRNANETKQVKPSHSRNSPLETANKAAVTFKREKGERPFLQNAPHLILIKSNFRYLDDFRAVLAVAAISETPLT